MQAEKKMWAFKQNEKNYTFQLYLPGLLMGMTNMAATVPGFVVPALVGTLTHGVVSTYTYHTLPVKLEST